MTDRTPHRVDYTSPAWNRRKDAAMAQAAVLRREAMDEFWRDASAWLALGVNRAGRAAQRLRLRLGRHRQQARTPTPAPALQAK